MNSPYYDETILSEPYWAALLEIGSGAYFSPDKSISTTTIDNDNEILDLLDGYLSYLSHPMSELSGASSGYLSYTSTAESLLKISYPKDSKMIWKMRFMGYLLKGKKQQPAKVVSASLNNFLDAPNDSTSRFSNILSKSFFTPKTTLKRGLWKHSESTSDI